MKTKFCFAHLCCVAVFAASGALADDNRSFTEQLGERNTALIDQTRLDAVLGAPAPTESNLNRVGRGNLPALQDGDDNQLQILQGGRRNRAGSRAGTFGIVQGGDNNVLSLTQSGLRNEVVDVFQGNDDHSATIIQAGEDNFIEAVVQTGQAGNTASLTLDGNLNGDRPIRGGNFANVGVLSSALIQAGRRNQIAVTFDGNRNRFGFLQAGRDNVVDNGSDAAALIQGNRNRLGVSQLGPGNTLSLVQFDGSRNDVGVDQSLGGSATLTLDGDDNAFVIRQELGANTVNLSITGDLNGGTAAFSSVAATLEAGAPGSGLEPGVISQSGTNNNVNLTINGVAGAGTIGTGNLFGIVQNGRRNSVNGEQSGDANEVAILQNGRRNTVNFTQTGVGNVLAVSQ